MGPAARDLETGRAVGGTRRACKPESMEVASGVHRFGSRFVNWYLVEQAGKLTLVDAGLRGYWPQLQGALRSLGCILDDVEAVVLTHAHADHIGFAQRLRSATGAAVHVHQADAEPGFRRYPPLRQYLRSSSWPMAYHAARMGLFGTPDAAAVAEAHRNGGAR